jgi:DNA-binding LytR/AlgR family response regulator
MKYYRIGICDDEEAALDNLYKIAKEEFGKKDCDFEIIKFNNAKNLIEYNCEENFDIIFLDIEMPEFNGIDAAKSIKNINKNTVIVFVTCKDELVYESLKAQPFRFIRKSRLKEEISETVSEVYKLFDERSYKINIKIENKYYEIDVNSILYIESSRNYIIVNTVNHKEFKYRDSINKKEKELENYGFIRTHFGYLVNQKYIYSIKNDFVILKDNIKIPVSRSRRQYVRQKLLDYLR